MKLFVVAIVVALGLGAAPAGAQPLLDDDWTIKPGAGQKYTFTLSAPTTVRLEVYGVKHADKGFRVELSDEGNEVARSFRRTLHWSAGVHVLEVKNTENVLHRVTVHVRLTPIEELSSAPAMRSEKDGQCVETTVSRVGYRLEGASDSGTSITFATGLGLVSYDHVPEAVASKSGDAVKVCLTSIPAGCPPGDDRGRTYTVTNKRTNKTFSMMNSQHSCGGA